MIESRQEIRSRLIDLIEKRFEVDMSQFSIEDYDLGLLSLKFRMEARHLLYLFFDVEKEFQITIPEQAIIEGRFNSINDIVAIISESIGDAYQEGA